MCIEAVQNNIDNLEYVPDKLKTEKMCLAGIERSIYFIEYIPEKLQTEELISLLIKNLKDTSLRKYEDRELLSHICEKYGSEVEKEFVKIFGFDRGDVDFWLDRCEKLFDDENYCEAIINYNIAIRLYPSCPELYEGRSRAYRLMKEKAQKDLEKILELGYDC